MQKCGENERERNEEEYFLSISADLTSARIFIISTSNPGRSAVSINQAGKIYN